MIVKMFDAVKHFDPVWDLLSKLNEIDRKIKYIVKKYNKTLNKTINLDRAVKNKAMS